MTLTPTEEFILTQYPLQHNPETGKQMSRRQQLLLTKRLKKEKFEDEEILQWILYFDTLGKPVAQRAACKWMCNRVIILPKDEYKVHQAVKVAKINHVDPLSYTSPMELIFSFEPIREPMQPIDPATVNTLHFHYNNGRGIDVYEVDESEESRVNMRRIIDTHFGMKCNPWCLLAGDGNGNLTKLSARYWEVYSRYPKRVAFRNGRLLAFSAEEWWWDRMNCPHIGSFGKFQKVPNDPLGRWARYKTDPFTGYSELVGDIYRGSKENGLCERYRSLADTEPYAREFYCNGQKLKMNCPGLTSAKMKALFSSSDLANGIVRIPASFKSIPDKAFSNAKTITEVYIPDTVKTLGTFVFEGCTSLRKVRLPSHLTAIPTGMFWGCRSLCEIEIPASVEAIGAYAFSTCSSLKEIKLPMSMKSILRGTFQDCTALEKIEISGSVTAINKDAFCCCTSLSDLRFPDDLETIEDGAFQGCRSLKDINIPVSLTTIGKGAFSASGLTQIVIPDTIHTVVVTAFAMCLNLHTFSVCKRWYHLFHERYGRKVQLLPEPTLKQCA